MTRWWIVIGALIVVLALAGCGGDGDKDNGGGDSNSPVAGDATTDASATPVQATRAPAITATFRPPAPRSKELPGGEPVDFETPFNAGNFIRDTLTGNPVSAQTGGQRATYSSNGATVVVTVFYFAQMDEATRTAEFTLNNAGGDFIGEPYYAPTVSFGIVQHSSGDHIAAWSHQGWAFIAQTESLDVLQTFLDVFPY
jgi:hypothetical protein